MNDAVRAHVSDWRRENGNGGKAKSGVSLYELAGLQSVPMAINPPPPEEGQRARVGLRSHRRSFIEFQPAKSGCCGIAAQDCAGDVNAL